MIKVNRCLDLCSDTPQIISNQQLAVFGTSLFLVVNFLLKCSRISPGDVGWCVDVEKPAPSFLVIVSPHPSGEGEGVRVGSCKGQSSANMCQTNAAHTFRHMCVTHFLLVVFNQLSRCRSKKGNKNQICTVYNDIYLVVLCQLTPVMYGKLHLSCSCSRTFRAPCLELMLLMKERKKKAEFFSHVKHVFVTYWGLTGS